MLVSFEFFAICITLDFLFRFDLEELFSILTGIIGQQLILTLQPSDSLIHGHQVFLQLADSCLSALSFLLPNVLIDSPGMPGILELTCHTYKSLYFFI